MEKIISPRQWAFVILLPTRLTVVFRLINGEYADENMIGLND